MHSYVSIKRKGNFARAFAFFDEMLEHQFIKKLEKYGEMGVQALQSATPVRTGKTAASWSYRIVKEGDSISLQWENTNATRDGDNIVMLLIKGHGTRSGSYFRGNDFVTPAIRPIFDEMLAKLGGD